MPLVSALFFILGLVVASVKAQENLSQNITIKNNIQSVGSNESASEILSNMTNITSPTANMTAAVSTVSSIMNITNASSTITALPTESAKTSKDNKVLQDTMTTPKPAIPTKTTSPTKPNDKPNDKTTHQKSNDSTGIIILVVIVLVALIFGITCYFARKRGRRYSVDLTSRQDEANIPLSTMEPELHIDTVSQNGLQTFESVETAAKEPQEPEAKPEVQEDQKAEAEKPVVEPSAESAAPAPTPDSSEDKPKDEVAEQSPLTPVEPSVEEKTDDEGVVSTKTSVESLKETNQNNSNSADVSQKWDFNSDGFFWDVPLNCPL